MNICLCLKAAFVLFWCCLHITKGEPPLEIIVDGKVKEYGQNLTLFCKIHGCCPEGGEWTVGNDTLFIDVTQLVPSQVLGVPPKYMATHNVSGIGLIILNMSTSDLNREHGCFYHRYKGNLTLLYKDVFSNHSCARNDLAHDRSLIVVVTSVCLFLLFIA